MTANPFISADISAKTLTRATGPTHWRRLEIVVETARELSSQSDPQTMARDFRARMQLLRPTARFVSLSRRDLPAPLYRITRSSLWDEEINPWKEPDRLPLLDSGLLGELLYGDQPRVIDDLRVDPDDPTAEYFEGQRSLVAVPIYDSGVGTNMVVLMRHDRAAFDREEFPDLVLQINLFGRAIVNLLLSRELRAAYDLVDRELRTIESIQQSLLPATLPDIPTMQLAAHYQTSRRAGGDYYDFFPLEDGKWGILIADVSGHGTPAAVMMAITHSIAHSHPEPPHCPNAMMNHLNDRLCERYTTDNRTFVTAFYGVYDPATRKLLYACAGHNPPRLKRCEDGSIFSLNQAGGVPLGVLQEQQYELATQVLRPGDQIIFYTDGITEAMNPQGDMFGQERLDQVLENCTLYASALIERLMNAVSEFTAGRPADDDRTVLVAKIS
jgi:sigma-B regulation protein RsbU (phosphoserine phosphatase)